MDRYDLQARLAPALLTILPGALGLAAWLQLDTPVWGSIGSFGLATSASYLMRELVRDAGRSVQGRLYAQWGGPPTATALSFLDSWLPPDRATRYRTALRMLYPAVDAPLSEKEEAANPLSSKEAWNAYIEVLREDTRAGENAKILLKENISYGFRRNALALRSLGRVSAGIGLALAGSRIVIEVRHNNPDIVVPATYFVVALMAGVSWTTYVNDDWVKKAAHRYAEQLLRIGAWRALGGLDRDP